MLSLVKEVEEVVEFNYGMGVNYTDYLGVVECKKSLDNFIDSNKNIIDDLDPF